jgi:hypothetical protein
LGSYCPGANHPQTDSRDFRKTGITRCVFTSKKILHEHAG